MQNSNSTDEALLGRFMPVTITRLVMLYGAALTLEMLNELAETGCVRKRPGVMPWLDRIKQVGSQQQRSRSSTSVAPSSSPPATGETSESSCDGSNLATIVGATNQTTGKLPQVPGVIGQVAKAIEGMSSET